MAADSLGTGRRVHPSHGPVARQFHFMNARHGFSLGRFRAMVVKEFVQMRRDRVTFGMMVGIPLIQLVLFGFAINSDPKHLPAAILLADNGPQGRTLLHAIRNSSYFEIVRQVTSETEARDALAR